MKDCKRRRRSESTCGGGFGGFRNGAFDWWVSGEGFWVTGTEFECGGFGC